MKKTNKKAFFFILLGLCLITSCIFKNSDSLKINQDANQKNESSVKNTDKEVTSENTEIRSNTKNLEVEKKLLSEKTEKKKFNQIFKFIDSVEREVLKLTLKEKAPAFTFWGVIYQALEIANGEKVGQLTGFDCSLFKTNFEKNYIEIFKLCEKKEDKIIKIQKNQIETNKIKLEVSFTGASWAKYSGPSTSLQQIERICHVTVVNFKVESFSCENMTFDMNEDRKSLNIYELKVSEYKYSQQSNEEVKFSGSIYKDLLEKRKLNLTVPLTGPIKIYEKELKVIDEFESIQKKLLLEEPEKKEEAVIGSTEENSTQAEKNLQHINSAAEKIKNNNLNSNDNMDPQNIESDQQMQLSPNQNQSDNQPQVDTQQIEDSQTPSLPVTPRPSSGR